MDLTGIAARWLRPQASAACPHHGQGRQTERSEGWWTRPIAVGTNCSRGAAKSTGSVERPNAGRAGWFGTPVPKNTDRRRALYVAVYQRLAGPTAVSLGRRRFAPSSLGPRFPASDTEPADFAWCAGRPPNPGRPACAPASQEIVDI